jgi:zinc transporter, ZIP family
MKMLTPLLLTLLAGIFTLLGSFISLLLKNTNKRGIQFALGMSAGVMIYLSFMELMPVAVKGLGFFTANLGFFAGILGIMLVDFIIPHDYIGEKYCLPGCEKKVIKASVLTAIGITIHNLPEGMAVFIAAVGNIKLGIAITFAIALHNIPEGIAVSVPIFNATGSKRKALLFSFIAGMAEPLGAILALLFLMPFMSPAVLAFTFALVAGVMVFISFDELLPLAYNDSGDHTSILGILAGMLIMAISLHLLG